MRAKNGPGSGKRISPLRLALLVLVLTLVVFGILGALVTYIPGFKRSPALEEKGKAPQVRQLDRESLHKDTPRSAVPDPLFPGSYALHGNPLLACDAGSGNLQFDAPTTTPAFPCGTWERETNRFLSFRRA
jgi:hypothetical protein